MTALVFTARDRMHDINQSGACLRAVHLNSGDPNCPLSGGFSMTKVAPTSKAARATCAENSTKALCLRRYACSRLGSDGNPVGRSLLRSCRMEASSHHSENEEQGVPIHTIAYLPALTLARTLSRASATAISSSEPPCSRSI